MASVFLAVGGYTAYQQPIVNAASSNVAVATGDADSSIIPIDQHNFLDYFKLNGSATYNTDSGVVSLTSTKQWISGMTYLNSNMDLSKSFSLTGSIQVVPSDPNDLWDGYGDGISFAFRPGDPTTVGNFGEGMGVGGIPGAFGVVMDTVHNAGSEGGRSFADPVETSPYIGFFQNVNDSSIGTSSSTDNIPNSSWAKSVINDDSHEAHTFSYNDFDQGKTWLPFSISYNGNKKTMTYGLTVGNQKYTDSYDFSKNIQADGPFMNLAISAANGLSAASMNVRINDIEYSAVGVVNVSYLDADTNKEISDEPTQTLKGSLTTDATINPKVDELAQKGYRLVKVDAPAAYNYDRNTLPFSGSKDISKLPFDDVLQNVKFYFKKDPVKTISVNVVHVDADDHDKVIGKDVSLSGAFGDNKDVPQETIPGYTADAENPRTFRLGSLDKDGKTATQVVLKYHETKTTPVTPGGGSSSASSDSSSSSSSVLPSSSTPSANSSSQDQGSSVISLPNYAVEKDAAVYALKPLYLYKQADFKKGERIAKYVKKPRIDRPMFVVTGYARSTAGKLRYEVRDVNHHSRTDGKTGYITADWQYVRPVYYTTKRSPITVISPKGVNTYQHKNLTGKLKNYKQGTVLKVKGIVKHNLATRYQLANGKFVTANRKLVMMGRHHQVTKVRAKTDLNRYRDVNLTRRNHRFNAGKVFKVYSYDYSHGNDVTKRGTLRYRVAGGFISGNSKYVKAIR